MNSLNTDRMKIKWTVKRELEGVPECGSCHGISWQMQVFYWSQSCHAEGHSMYGRYYMWLTSHATLVLETF